MTRRSTRWSQWFAVACLLMVVSRGAADEWHVDTGAEVNHVEFASDVASLTFTGTTSKIDGYLYWEGDSLFAEKAQLRFEVDLNSLDTGVGKRDRDMRDVLETKKWPKAIYDARITGHTAVDTTITAYRVRTKGTFQLHGVSREVEIPGMLILGDTTAVVRSQFRLLLDDYDIEAPGLVAFIKVSEEIDVSLTVQLKAKKREAKE
jgi:polyisoprenoid-binding protein YceI